MRKLICLALLSSLLIAGCASDARDAQPVPVAAPEEDASAPAADVFSFLDDEGNAAFSLVCDLGSGEETLADILRIRDAYEERFGVSLPVIDSGREDTGGAEIVVAARSRDDCAALLSSLISGEYAISVTMDGDVPKINLAYK